ncbi:MAG TPA: restriction endonuclease subunit S [Solirubrobacteraceae bacterium]|jgi:type I restriction enzyme S subunit
MRSESPVGWRLVLVGELIDGGQLIVNDGYRAKNSELGDEGLPFARAGNVRDGFHLADADRLSSENVRRAGAKVSESDDVVFTSKGTVGRFAFVRGDTPRFAYSPQLCFWRVVDRSSIDPGFLFGWIRGPQCALQFKGLKGQTDMADYISLRDQRTISMLLPPIEEQKRIASVLSALDEKIESNHRMREVLLATGAGLVERAQGHGSTPVSVGDVAQFHNKRRIPLSSSQRALRPGPFPYYGATGVLDSIDDYLFSGRYVLVGEDGSVQTEEGHPVVQYAWGAFWVNNHAHVLTFDDAAPEVGYLIMRQATVTPFVTGAVQPKLSMRRLKEVSLRWPQDMAAIEAEVRSLFELFRLVTAEATSLTELRSALLPRLVSGEICVPDTTDAEEAIGRSAEQLTGAKT